MTPRITALQQVLRSVLRDNEGMRKFISSPKKAFVAATLASVSVLPIVATTGHTASAASTKISVVAPATYDRWAGVAGQWTRNFRINGPLTQVVTVGVNVGSAKSHDSVSFPERFTSGLTLSYGFSSWQNMKSIAFTGTIFNVNKALSAMTLNAVGSGASKMTVYVTKAELNMSFQPSNGHFYEYVSSRGIKWTDAKAAAEATTFRGVKGYLATVTDERENLFVAQSIPGASNVWLGGTDAAKEGVWKWATGPEKGRTFMTMTCAIKTGDNACNGANVLKTPGSSSVQYSDLATSDIKSKTYARWAFQEPNNWGTTGEHYVATNWQGTVGEWNDLADNTAQINGYVVEYSGKFGRPAPQVYSATTTINKVPVRYAPINVRASKSGSAGVIAWNRHEAIGRNLVSVTVKALPSNRVVCQVKPYIQRCMDAKLSKSDKRYLVSFAYASRPTATSLSRVFTSFVNIPK